MKLEKNNHTEQDNQAPGRQPWYICFYKWILAVR